MRVRVRETGKTRWLYLDGKGGETRLLVRAAHYAPTLASEIAANIIADNSGTWEAESVE
jgi:hypothetical protein